MLFRNSFERRVFAVGVVYATVVAAVLLYLIGNVFTRPDAISHTYIAASIVRNGAQSKFANLGTVWLPLPHLLLAPLLLLKPLYSTGLAGTIMSGLATGGILVYLTRIVTYITDQRRILYGAIILFLSSGMTAVYSATPMTEQLSIFLGIASLYYFLRYWKEDSMPYFVISSAFAVFATLTRYEFWFLAAVYVVLLGVREVRSGREHNLAFFHLPLWGGGLWFIWNGAIFGDPLYFMASRSMATSIFLESTLQERAVFLGVLLLIGGGSFLLPFIMGAEYRQLAIAPTVVYGMFVVSYLFGIRGLLSNLRFGYVVFGMLLPCVVALRRFSSRTQTVLFTGLVISAMFSSALVMSGVYSDLIGAGGVQEREADQATLPPEVTLHPISHTYDMDYYPRKYLDAYDGQEWIAASKQPWERDIEYVVIPNVSKDRVDNYRVSGPNKGIVWNFYRNEDWRETFRQHFTVVDPKVGLYKRVNASANTSVARKQSWPYVHHRYNAVLAQPTVRTSRGTVTQGECWCEC